MEINTLLNNNEIFANQFFSLTSKQVNNEKLIERIARRVENFKLINRINEICLYWQLKIKYFEQHFSNSNPNTSLCLNTFI